jgi:hypothetical protein
MVECNVRWQLPARENECLSSVVHRPWLPFGGGNEDSGDRVTAWITARIRVDTEQAGDCHVQTGLLKCLAQCSLLCRLTVVDESSWDGPSIWGIKTFYKDDSTAPTAGGKLDYDINGGQRVAEALDFGTARRAAMHFRLSSLCVRTAQQAPCP